ncbi:MAG: uroporphyrinogen decarboxylase family protein [Sedimentisphaerales bacterium]|nr:uroporphyrinogen decarboxylase family protein [Sedimentisphaerales bacterium]
MKPMTENKVMSTETCQLISYIAPAAPATRRPVTGGEKFLRPEIGFTPNWYRTAIGIDFGRQWHTDPAYRRRTILEMRSELKRRFPETGIGGIDQPDRPMDILTGTYGCVSVAAIYGVPAVYAEDNWPNCEHKYLSDNELDHLKPPDLDRNHLFRELMAQVDWIAASEGRIEGYMNWQGVLNNAYRLRGEQLFYDFIDCPKRCRHLFDCVCTTMIEGASRLYKRQMESGVRVNFLTVSNCLVNMISPEQYRDILLPFDCRIAEAFGSIGIHNCAWNADPYIDDYAGVPNVSYIDMGLDSNLARAKKTFTDARRAIVYKPTDLTDKSLETIRIDLENIACEYAPCDVVVGDIDAGTPDERVLAFFELCSKINSKMEN